MSVSGLWVKVGILLASVATGGAVPGVSTSAARAQAQAHAARPAGTPASAIYTPDNDPLFAQP